MEPSPSFGCGSENFYLSQITAWFPSCECGSQYNYGKCFSETNKYYYRNIMQQNLESPMPWVGMYIAAASAVCTLAMAADALNGFRMKRPWLPCKYFSLNATSLTLLAVTMKLTVDLTSTMLGINDKIATVSSLVFMSTAISNLMTSVASMDNNEILLNLTALGILIFTIAGNVCIHNAEAVSMETGTVDTGVTVPVNVVDRQIVYSEETAAVAVMILLFAVLCFSSLVIPTAKKYIESKYLEMHKIASNEQGEGGEVSTHELSVQVKKYWVMAETGSPQFVMARSAISGTSGLMCLLIALTLVKAYVLAPLRFKEIPRTDSNYKWSINWILIVQTVGVGLATIAPLLRWFMVARFKITETGQKSLRDEFKIETYWTLRLVEWRDSSLPLKIRNHKCRKLLHGVKRLVLNICIGVQILFVVASKLVLFLSTTCGRAIFWCVNLARAPNDMRESGAELDISRYMLLLDGEEEIPRKILTNICNEIDRLIHIGRQNKPTILIDLLKKSSNFKGLREFDSNQVPGLHDREPPNCWSLPVVTLTCVGAALANITNHNRNQSLNGVSQGLKYAKLIEKAMDKNGRLENVRNAADVVWIEAELYNKWQGKDLQVTRSEKETLQELSNIAAKTVLDFKAGANDLVMQNPLNWPAKVIAANSMYRISQTILKDDSHEAGEELIERLSIMISEIVGACLTNLAYVINLKCHANTIRDREKSIREAAVLVGESEEILEILQQRELPFPRLDPEKAADIEEWRALMEEQGEDVPMFV